MCLTGTLVHTHTHKCTLIYTHACMLGLYASSSLFIIMVTYKAHIAVAVSSLASAINEVAM